MRTVPTSENGIGPSVALSTMMRSGSSARRTSSSNRQSGSYRGTVSPVKRARSSGSSGDCGCPAKSSSRPDFHSSCPDAGSRTLSWRTPA